MNHDTTQHRFPGDHTKAAPVAQGDLQLIAIEPDLDEARRFLDVLDSGGQFTFQTLPDNRDAPHDRKLNLVVHGSFEEHADVLASLNIQGAGVFVMVNEGDGVVHTGKRTCRTIRNVVRVRCAFVDLDGSPLDPILDAPVVPSIIVESSPNRWHAYWKLNDCPLEEFKHIQRALAEKFDGDAAVNDLCRVMRLPGFVHQKAAPFMSRMIFPVGSKQ